MASAEADPGTGVLQPAHAGAWTEEAYLALSPADRVHRRVELLDGSLLVAPGTGERHAAAVAAVRAAVAAVLPPGLEVTGPVALRLGPGRILVPDLVVAAPAAEGTGEVRDSSVALVVIDVVGRANGVADRWFKPQLYAGCRIPYALLVDHDEPFAVGSMLIGGRFHEYAEAGPGGVLRLDEPFHLELDLAALTAGGGPDAAGAEPVGDGSAEGDPGGGDPAQGGAGGEDAVDGDAAGGAAGGDPAAAGPAGDDPTGGEPARGDHIGSDPTGGDRPGGDPARGAGPGVPASWATARGGAGRDGAGRDGAGQDGTGSDGPGSHEAGPDGADPRTGRDAVTGASDDPDRSREPVGAGSDTDGARPGDPDRGAPGPA
jgi:hypothetical protein